MTWISSEFLRFSIQEGDHSIGVEHQQQKNVHHMIEWRTWELWTSWRTKRTCWSVLSNKFRYVGRSLMVVSLKCVMSRILKSIRALIGSQWSVCNTGVMCSCSCAPAIQGRLQRFAQAVIYLFICLAAVREHHYTVLV